MPQDGHHSSFEERIAATPTERLNYMSTPAQKDLLVGLIREMKVRPLGKSPKLSDLVEWVVHELPKVAPDDSRTPHAVRLANILWVHERSSK